MVEGMLFVIRILVPVNPYLNSKYYANHGLFKEKYELDPDPFSSIKSVFSFCLSNGAIEPLVAGTNCDLSESVKREDILNCSIGSWSSIICVSSNALLRKIHSYYP